MPEQAIKIGVKRSPQTNIESLELGTALVHNNIEEFELKNKDTGEVKKFNILSDSTMAKLSQNKLFSKYDMGNLEVEYDYETENEQIRASKTML